MSKKNSNPLPPAGVVKPDPPPAPPKPGETSPWSSMDSAPRDRRILVRDGGEVYISKYETGLIKLSLVRKEFDICSESSYLDSHCFKMAKSSQCTLIR